jgi:hypothetical protein
VAHHVLPRDLRRTVGPLAYCIPAARVGLVRVLIACESSGTVRDAFRAFGHDAWSCDLLPSERPGQHFRADLFDAVGMGWDLVIAHPPCTFLSSSGLHWNRRRPERAAQTLEALEFVRQIMAAPVEKLAIENPIGCISSQIRRPDQIIQPWQYGHDASKATCLWLRGLPPLVPTERVLPRLVNGRPRWANQTDSGQNRLGPSPTRWRERSRTYQGIADAMAAQWGAADKPK